MATKQKPEGFEEALKEFKRMKWGIFQEQEEKFFKWFFLSGQEFELKKRQLELKKRRF